MQRRAFRNTIFYYLKIWFLNLKASTKKSNAYKSEIIVRLSRTILLVGIQVLLLNLVFGNQEIYIGWTKTEAYLVMGLWNLLNYSGWALFGVNLDYLERKIVEGDFDFVLLKPLSSSWLASFCEFSVYNWISSLAGVALIAYYVVQQWSTLTIWGVILCIVGIIIGLMLWYAFYLFFASFTVSHPRNGFLAITKELLGLTRYPVNIYGESLQFIWYTLLPIGFITTLPANLLIGRGSIYLLLVGLGIAILFLNFSQWVWKQNVKKYVSAGG